MDFHQRAESVSVEITLARSDPFVPSRGNSNRFPSRTILFIVGHLPMAGLQVCRLQRSGAMSTSPVFRRWFRFSLRTFLILTTLLSILTGWLINERKQAKLELGIADQITRMGGTVEFRGKHDDLSSSPDSQSAWRRLLRSVEGPRVHSLKLPPAKGALYELFGTMLGVESADLKPIARLSNLRTLVIQAKAIDLEPLAGLETLQSLSLVECRIGNVEALSKLTNLEALNLRSTNIRDLAPLGQLTYLNELNLAHTKLDGIESIAGLPNLDSLDLSDSGIRDLTPLAGLRNLKFLYLDGTKARDIAPLAKLINLEHLGLERSAVRDLTPLSQLKDLTWLNLSYTPVSDLKPLVDLPNLQHLDLSRTKVRQIPPISNLRNLSFLDLQQTGVTDLMNLTALVNLQELDLGFTPVSDVAPLAKLKYLRRLDLSDTKSSERQIEALRKSLPDCKIE
jgi:Leucine-rich repeat (LRR) protein